MPNVEELKAAALSACMLVPAEKGKRAEQFREEIAKVVTAWQRGELAPRTAAPLLLRVLSHVEMSAD